MISRMFLSCLGFTLLLSGCSSAPPLTAEDVKKLEVNKQKSLAYFSNRITVVNDAKSNPLRIAEIELIDKGGTIHARYYKKDASTPFSETPATSCSGTVDNERLIYCALNDGVHRWTSIMIEEVKEDRVEKDTRILSLRETLYLKKGQIYIHIRQSPSNWEFIGEMKKTAP